LGSEFHAEQCLGYDRATKENQRLRLRSAWASPLPQPPFPVLVEDIKGPAIEGRQTLPKTATIVSTVDQVLRQNTLAFLDSLRLST